MPTHLSRKRIKLLVLDLSMHSLMQPLNIRKKLNDNIRSTKRIQERGENQKNKDKQDKISKIKQK